MEKIIEVKGLTKKFGNLTAVNNLDLNVYRGDVFGFLGPNGAGKSTTIRMLLSLIKPTKGEIRIFGRDLIKERCKILRSIGAIVEKPDFYKYLPAYKNLEILGRLSGADTSEKHIMSVLDSVGLAERADSKVKTFSHGMKQRLGLAQALLHDPELIILDEPTTGLDPQGMKEIRDMIINLSKEKGKTIFLSSHILREVELIADRMIIINKGKTIVEGRVDELLNREHLKVEVETDKNDSAEEDINRSEWEKNYKGIQENRLIFEMEKENIAELNRFLLEKGYNVSASIIPGRSLEEYFIRMVMEGQ